MGTLPRRDEPIDLTAPDSAKAARETAGVMAVARRRFGDSGWEFRDFGRAPEIEHTVRRSTMAVPTGNVEDEAAAREAGNSLMLPLTLGPFRLAHRIVMSPMTRCRSYGGIPQPHAAVYYAQRATRGGLLVSEATGVSATSEGYPHAPGIWTGEQIDAWRPIVEAVHERGGVFFCQLSHVGRRSHSAFQDGGGRPVSSTERAIRTGEVTLPDGSLAEYSAPRALREDEMGGVAADFAAAAKNAISAGFDGVELHAANGYLLDQFLKDGINDREDGYGGPVENRARLTLEVARAVAAAVGRDRVGIKLSPFADFGEARDADEAGLGVYLAEQLSRVGILYATFVEARIQEAGDDASRTESLWPFRRAFRGGAFFVGGGYDRKEGMRAVESGKADAVVFGRAFLANPDLVRRFEQDAPLNEPRPETFFAPDPVLGYTDYPFLPPEGY